MNEIIPQLWILVGEALKWLTFGPGAGLLAYRIMEVPRVISLVNFLHREIFKGLGIGSRESKRIVSFLVSWSLSMVGYSILLVMGLANPNNLANTVISLSGLSTVTGQLVHGRTLDKEE